MNNTGPYTQVYNDMRVLILSESEMMKSRNRMCRPYRFLVTTWGFTNYTAFETWPEFRLWLKNYNLKLDRANWYQSKGRKLFSIIGQIESKSCLHAEHVELFNNLKCDVETRDLSNGDYVLFKIIYTDKGSEAYHLNPNVKDRLKFDYFESSELKRLGLNITTLEKGSKITVKLGKLWTESCEVVEKIERDNERRLQVSYPVNSAAQKFFTEIKLNQIREA